jgi:hypothetical protein
MVNPQKRGEKNPMWKQDLKLKPRAEGVAQVVEWSMSASQT